MIYKRVIKNKVIYFEDDTLSTDVITIPKPFWRFNLYYYIINPNVEIFRYTNYKWETVYYFPYRKLFISHFLEKII